MCGASYPAKNVFSRGFLTTCNPRKERKRAWPIGTELGVPSSSLGLLAAWLRQVHGRFPLRTPPGQSPGLGGAWRGESHREVFVPYSVSRERHKQLRAPRAPSRWF